MTLRSLLKSCPSCPRKNLPSFVILPDDWCIGLMTFQAQTLFFLQFSSSSFLFRCSSFYHAPPPYTEVTSKPDLYPLVFSYESSKNSNNGGNYLMVQYFRNYIVRPIGSLSATSTVDSLSSSFICTANEANSNIPPPYSSTASPEAPSVSLQNLLVPRSASQHNDMKYATNTTMDSRLSVGNVSLSIRPMSVPNTNQNPMYTYHQFRTSESANFANISCFEEHNRILKQEHHVSSSTSTTQTISSRSRNQNFFDDDIDFKPSNPQDLSIEIGARGMNSSECNQVPSIYHSNDTMLSLSAAMMDKISYSRRTNDHTKLNMIQKQLEKCCEMIQQQQDVLQQTRITSFDSHSSSSGDLAKKMIETVELGYMNSDTGSTVSSLANLNSPVVPCVGLSPTQEVKDLLYQIKQLKDSHCLEEENHTKVEMKQKSDLSFDRVRNSPSKRPTTLNSKKRFFNAKNQSVYLPIDSNSFSESSKLLKGKNSFASGVFIRTRGMKSRVTSKSAPVTPAGIPSNFMNDDSPLLNEMNEQYEENN